MNFKQFWKESTVAFVLKRILLAVALFVTMAWITLIILDHYTKHGESVSVPDLRGLYVEEAQSVLKGNDLYALVIDSVYLKDKALGTIVEQIPVENSFVKKNRSIFLIVNKKQVKMIPLPEVSDVSYRQADALLKSLGLKVLSVEYQPSEFKDLVIDVRYQGKSLEAGTRLPEGASVVLVVGSGMGSDISRVPSLVGLSIQQAKSQAVANAFVIGAVNYDVTPSGDEDSYLVFKQKPAGNESVPAGTSINIWLTKDQGLIDNALQNQQKSVDEEEEEFF